jgi:hypothetical protein
MFELPDYKTNGVGFIRTADPDAKTYDYFLKNCQAQYTVFFQGRGYIPYDRSLKFAQLRLFSQGNQPEDFYKKYLSPAEQGEQITMDSTMGAILNDPKRLDGPKGFMNVLWDVMSTAPRIMAGLIGTLTRYGTEMSADPIDEHSRSLVEEEKLRLKMKVDNHQFYKAFHKELDIPYQPPDMMPENDEELAVYEDAGKFKPYFATVMEKLFKHTMDISNWEEIEKKLYRDALNCGVIGVIEDYDPEDGKWKPYYVDPATSGRQWSKYADGRDATYGWDFYDENISTVRQYLREQFKELTAADFEKQVMCTIAKSFCGYNGNPTVDYWESYNKIDAWGNWRYDSFKVNIMRNRWIDNQGRQDVYFKNDYGHEKTYEIAWAKIEKSKNGKVYQFTEKRMLFEANWVVGTKYLTKWGPAPDQNKPSKRDVSLPYHFYTFEGKSPTEQLVPVYHNFQQLWIKYLNCINSAVNDGYNINIDYLMNIAMSSQDDETAKKDGIDYTSVKRFLETGLNYYSEINPTGVKNINSRPIDRIPGGMGNMFKDLIMAFDFNLKLVEMLTGINPIMLGGTPSNEAPVATTQMSVEAVSNILKPLVDGYLSVKKNMAVNMVRYIQLSIKYNAFSRKSYAKFLGELDIAVMQEAEEGSVEYAINFTPRATDAEKKAFIDALNKSIQAGQLDPFDEVLFMSRLSANVPIKQVLLEMKYRQREWIKQQTEQAKQKADLEHNNRMMEITAGQKAQLELEIRLHDFKMEELAVTAKNNMANTALKESINREAQLGAAQVKANAQVQQGQADNATEMQKHQGQMDIQKQQMEQDAQQQPEKQAA